MTTMVPLEIALVAIGASMVAGVVDLLRLPGWAWKKAEEPKLAYTALVGLLPLVGLGMYAVRARPKVKDVVVAGRAASLPFERFGDGAPALPEEEAEAPEPLHIAATATATASPAPEPAPAAIGPEPTAERSEDTADEVAQPEPQPAPQPEPQPEPVGAGAGTFFSNEAPAAATATATATRTLRLPASLTNRAYHPRQRASLAEERITQAVPAGWKADPTGRHQFRYWNGQHWTENVADAGVQDRDPAYA
jgi:outer membrane biosynthesis protein TonB